ncbi:MAG: ornithine carbamoyltransferase [Endozoicomonadaceae bacterium]|nr:ornithine carbamoyltransferase [Endozoicomonadaceae bacterium]MCY4329879.1 ornithine carbamoyltransferase [Endozoicomonadaceae bacterium]
MLFAHTHFLADSQLTRQQLIYLITLAKEMKANPQDYQQSLAGKSVVMLFEKPSLRTHISFDIGIQKMGGHAIYVGQQNGRLGVRERVTDVAKNLSCWSDAIVARVFKQNTLEELAMFAGIPVINALSDLYHPCQILADFLTLSENFGDLSSIKLTYAGVANNISNSLMFMASVVGIDFTLFCPKGYGPDSLLFDQALDLAKQSNASLTIINDTKLIGEQNVLYTDTWISMGDNSSINDLEPKLYPYQLNHDLVKKTGATAIMHCQPAHLGQEITRELFDSNYCLARQQAINRMWVQNAVLFALFNNK